MNRLAFPKHVAIYRVLRIYGDNVVATEHDEVRIPVFDRNLLMHRHQWKRHRKVGAPAFSERINSVVHRETTRVVLNLFDAWKSEGMIDTVTVNNMADVAFELALQVIAAAGFGYNVAWKDDGSLPVGHTMVCPCYFSWPIVLIPSAVIQTRLASSNQQYYLARHSLRLGAWIVQEREGDPGILQRARGVYARDD